MSVSEHNQMGMGADDYCTCGDTWPCKKKETAMNAIKDTKLSLASLNHIIICGRCGALFLALGWSNDTHNAWHAEHNGGAA